MVISESNFKMSSHCTVDQTALYFLSERLDLLTEIALKQLELSLESGERIWLICPDFSLKDYLFSKICDRLKSTSLIEFKTLSEAISSILALSGLPPLPLKEDLWAQAFFLSSDLEESYEIASALSLWMKNNPTINHPLFANLAESFQPALSSLFNGPLKPLPIHLHLFGAHQLHMGELALLQRWAQSGGHLCIYMRRYSSILTDAPIASLSNPIPFFLHPCLKEWQKAICFYEKFSFISIDLPTPTFKDPLCQSFIAGEILQNPTPPFWEIREAPHEIEEILFFFHTLSSKPKGLCLLCDPDRYLPLLETLCKQYAISATLEGFSLSSIQPIKMFWELFQAQKEPVHAHTLASFLPHDLLPFLKPLWDYLGCSHLSFRHTQSSLPPEKSFVHSYERWKERWLKSEEVSHPTPLDVQPLIQFLLRFDEQWGSLVSFVAPAKDWMLKLSFLFETWIFPLDEEKRACLLFLDHLRSFLFAFDSSGALIDYKMVFCFLEKILLYRTTLHVGSGLPLFKARPLTPHLIEDHPFIAILGADRESLPKKESCNPLTSLCLEIPKESDHASLLEALFAASHGHLLISYSAICSLENRPQAPSPFVLELQKLASFIYIDPPTIQKTPKLKTDSFYSEVPPLSPSSQEKAPPVFSLYDLRLLCKDPLRFHLQYKMGSFSSFSPIPKKDHDLFSPYLSVENYFHEKKEDFFFRAAHGSLGEPALREIEEFQQKMKEENLTLLHIELSNYIQEPLYLPPHTLLFPAFEKKPLRATALLEGWTPSGLFLKKIDPEHLFKSLPDLLLIATLAKKYPRLPPLVVFEIGSDKKKNLLFEDLDALWDKLFSFAQNAIQKPLCPPFPHSLKDSLFDSGHWIFSNEVDPHAQQLYDILKKRRKNEL